MSSTVGTQISSAVICETAKMVAKSSRYEDEGASCWKNEDMVGPTMWYRRASGARRRYKPMAWRAIGRGGMVNQTTL